MEESHKANLTFKFQQSQRVRESGKERTQIEYEKKGHRLSMSVAFQSYLGNFEETSRAFRNA